MKRKPPRQQPQIDLDRVKKAGKYHKDLKPEQLSELRDKVKADQELNESDLEKVAGGVPPPMPTYLPPPPYIPPDGYFGGTK